MKNKWIALEDPSELDKIEELEGAFEYGAKIQFKTGKHRIINAINDAKHFFGESMGWLDSEDFYEISNNDKDFLSLSGDLITHYREVKP